MSGCRRQCDWDKNMVCRSCGIGYSLPEDKPVKVEADKTQEEE